MKVLGILTDWRHNEYRIKNDAYGAVSYYRIVKPLESVGQTWVGKKWDAKRGDKNNEEWYKELVQDWDIIITKHVDNPQAGAALGFMCQHFGKKLVVDLDDNLFEVKPDQPAWEQGYRPGGKARAYAGAFISQAAALIVSTEPLKEYYEKYLKEVFGLEKPIFVFPNYNDVADFRHIPEEKHKDKIVIGWQGSTTHTKDLKMVVPALGNILNKYPNVHLEFLGGIPEKDVAYLFKDLEDNVYDRISIIGGHPAWDKYPELLASMKWDIGIAPLVNDEFNRGKSHIKWMEYAMYQIPCVASKVYPYSTNIKPKTGFLATNTKDWTYKLEKLIKNPGLRKDVGWKAYDYIEKNLQYKDHADEYQEILNKIYAI